MTGDLGIVRRSQDGQQASQDEHGAASDRAWQARGAYSIQRTMMKIAAFVLIAIGALRFQDPTADAPKTPAAALQPFIDRHVLAGAVTLVATKDKILSHEAVGFMDVKAQTPMRPDALFWIASQSKSITATAVMMLVDEGK